MGVSNIQIANTIKNDIPGIFSGCQIHPSCSMYGINTIGKNCTIMEKSIIGFPCRRVLSEARSSGKRIEEHSFTGTKIGDNATIRPGSVLYCDVVIGDGFNTGHNAIIREMTIIGNNVLIGTNVVVDGNTRIGSNVSVQSNAYIPTNTTIEDNVFLGPCSVLTNDKYPIRIKYDLKGPVLRKGSSIGANSTILPGVEIGEGAMVAAGSVVTKDVPPWKLAIGSPARAVEMPDMLRSFNRI
jgi:acetyltransferase-like isoleucine patch superfamily enzyme